jgi:hypothetical protein
VLLNWNFVKFFSTSKALQVRAVKWLTFKVFYEQAHQKLRSEISIKAVIQENLYLNHFYAILTMIRSSQHILSETVLKSQSFFSQKTAI